MEQPLVSVVIPFYSGLNWLEEAIESVLRQTYKNIEIIVINDGSKENVFEIVHKYGSYVRLINQENRGPASARNEGIKMASGKYIAFLDSDDLWLPEKLSKQIAFMESSKYIWSQHSYEYFWDSKNKKKIINTGIYSGNVYKDCFISFRVQTSCVVVLKKYLIDNKILFPVEKRYAQDISFYKKIAQKCPLGYVDGVYATFRIKGTNVGFRTALQINIRALIWEEEIKNNKEVLRLLPLPVIFAYRTLGIFKEFVSYLNRKNIKNIEFISKVMYFFPYLVFRLYRKK